MLSSPLQWHKGARVPERYVSHYKIVEKIGGGGMGVVYKAVDTKLGRLVALKFLAPDVTRDETAKKRFLHEAQAASLLDHPNICSIHEIDETAEGQVFISMAFYEGVSLRERIKEGPIPIRETFEIMYSVADGLGCAHAQGIVHRDVKPGNLIITKEGFVKIVDFGLAKLADRSSLTRPGLTPGTLSYMSPEQVKAKEVNGRSDIWSLGVSVYEMLTGELPFQGDIEAAVMYQILNEEPAPIRKKRAEVPAEFEAIVQKCLRKNPAERYQSCGELIQDLIGMGRRLGWQSSGTVRTVMRVGSVAPSRPRRMILALSVIAVGVAVSLFGYWIAHRGPQEPELYSTKVRLAALPIENLARESVPDELADGMSEWLVGALGRMSALHPSMWVVPSDYVTRETVPAPSRAKEAFGVNRLLKGSIQRYGDGYRLALELVDAESLRRIGSAHVDFGTDVSVLQKGIVDRAAELLELSLSDEARTRLDSDFTSTATAFENHLRGLGYLQHYRSGDNLGRAVESLRNAVGADSLFADARAALALAFLRTCVEKEEKDQCENAWALCRRALEIDSNNIYVNFVAAAAAKEVENPQASIAAYRRIIAVEPRNMRAYWQMADVLKSLDRLDEAEAAKRASVAAAPDCWQTHIQLGWFLHKRGRTDEAVEQLEKALALAPSDAWTLNQLGTIFVEKDEWAKARGFYLRSFAVEPDWLACRNIGLLYYLERYFAESEKYFRFALEYCDSTASDYYQRWQDWAGALYWVEGRKPDADAAFRRAIALAEEALKKTPDNVELLAYTAGCYAMVGDRSRALSLIDRVVATGSEDPHIMFIIGQTYERLGDRERALHYIASAVRLKYRLSWIKAEPLLEDLTKDIRFQQLVEATAGEAVKEGAKNE